MAFLEQTRIPIRIDISFGDVIRPKPNEVDFPTLLGFPSPKIKTYPQETVIAEKFHAVTDLGMTNSRLKDFYDLYILTTNFEINRESLLEAISATFERRNTKIPTTSPIALTDEFSNDASRSVQWKSFLKKTNVSQEIKFNTVIKTVNKFFAELLGY